MGSLFARGWGADARLAIAKSSIDPNPISRGSHHGKVKTTFLASIWKLGSVAGERKKLLDLTIVESCTVSLADQSDHAMGGGAECPG
jgi:hypothetical protein